MDFSWKCLSWAGNICQKIEEIFPCDDEIVFQIQPRYLEQESIEYVHNQIQAAGVNVKQFCSALVDDVFCQSSSTNSLGESAQDSSALHRIDSLACENTKLKNDEIVELESSAREHFKPCLEEIVAIPRTKSDNLTWSITLMQDEVNGNNQVDSSASTISSADKTVDPGVSPLIASGLSKASFDNSADSTSEEGTGSLAPITMRRKTIQLANEEGFIMVDPDELESMYDKTLRSPVRREYVHYGGSTKPEDDENLRHKEIEAECQIHGGKRFVKVNHVTTADEQISEWEIIETDSLLMN